ncbi:hypothetical protein [Spirochaeta dissipatitropha]
MKLPLETSVLEERVEAISREAAKQAGIMQVIATGSFGLSPERVDGYSDLDLIVLVDPAAADKFYHSIEWLDSVFPISWKFKYYPDCWRLMFDDGLFCELAIQTPQALASLDYAGGRAIWTAPDCSPVVIPGKSFDETMFRNPEWLIQEILCNLFIAATKYHRGEHLSAMTYIHQECRKLLLELITITKGNRSAPSTDPYGLERRFEERYPDWRAEFSACFQGYDGISASISGMLELMNTHFQALFQNDSTFLIEVIRDLATA